MDFHQASPPENGANEMKSGFIQQNIFIILKIKLKLDYHLQRPTKKNQLFISKYSDSPNWFTLFE